MSFTTTRAPRSARYFAYDRPSPGLPPAPVTIATCPSNRIAGPPCVDSADVLPSRPSATAPPSRSIGNCRAFVCLLRQTCAEPALDLVGAHGHGGERVEELGVLTFAVLKEVATRLLRAEPRPSSESGRA